MYDARMDIYRWEDTEVNEITKHVKKVVATDRPCRYSSSGQVPAGVPDASIQNSYRLFCGLDEDVKEGDRLIITLRTGKVVDVDLGECHPYSYQWQCEIKRDDHA